MAMMVRPVAPVRAVKMAHVRRAIIDTPPGSQPSNASESLTSRLGAPLSERRYPANVKSGMATRIGVVAIRYISIITAEESIPPRYNRQRARPEITTNMGTPRSIKRQKTRTTSPRVICQFLVTNHQNAP